MPPFSSLLTAGALDTVEEDTENPPKDDLSEKQRHQLKHRELFLSRQVETLPATHIRGKCAVTLLNETESLLSYLNKEVGSDSHDKVSIFDLIWMVVAARFVFIISNIARIFVFVLALATNQSLYSETFSVTFVLVPGCIFLLTGL